MRNMVDWYIDRANLTSSRASFLFLVDFVLQNFHDTMIYYLIQNTRKMITNQKNLMMKQLKIFQIQTIYIPRILNYS